MSGFEADVEVGITPNRESGLALQPTPAVALAASASAPAAVPIAHAAAAAPPSAPADALTIARLRSELALSDVSLANAVSMGNERAGMAKHWQRLSTLSDASAAEQRTIRTELLAAQDAQLTRISEQVARISELQTRSDNQSIEAGVQHEANIQQQANILSLKTKFAEQREQLIFSGQDLRDNWENIAALTMEGRQERKRIQQLQNDKLDMQVRIDQLELEAQAHNPPPSAEDAAAAR